MVLPLLVLAGCAWWPARTDGQSTEVRSVDAEWNEYINHALGISIKFPKRVLEDGPYIRGGQNPTVPIRLVESGEVITFSRGFNFDFGHPDAKGEPPRVQEDLSTRHPRFSANYLNDVSYPYQIYVAGITTLDELKSFMRRTYGEGCIPGPPSTYDGKPGMETFSIYDDGHMVCPSVYSIGDIVIWNTEKNVAVGYQTRTGNFTKPYFVDPSYNNYYEIRVEGY